MRPKTNKANFDWKVTKREFDEDKYKNPLEDLKKDIITPRSYSENNCLYK